MGSFVCLFGGWVSLSIGLWHFEGSVMDAVLVANGVLNFALAGMQER